jgi:hypothetical protein
MGQRAHVMTQRLPKCTLRDENDQEENDNNIKQRKNHMDPTPQFCHHFHLRRQGKRKMAIASRGVWHLHGVNRGRGFSFFLLKFPLPPHVRVEERERKNRKAKFVFIMRGKKGSI